MRRDVRPAPCLNPPVFRPETGKQGRSVATAPPSRVSVRPLLQGVIDAPAAQELDHPPSYVFANALAYVVAYVLHVSLGGGSRHDLQKANLSFAAGIAKIRDCFKLVS